VSGFDFLGTEDVENDKKRFCLVWSLCQMSFCASTDMMWLDLFVWIAGDKWWTKDGSYKLGTWYCSGQIVGTSWKQPPPHWNTYSSTFLLKPVQTTRQQNNVARQDEQILKSRRKKFLTWFLEPIEIWRRGSNSSSNSSSKPAISVLSLVVLRCLINSSSLPPSPLLPAVVGGYNIEI
jgi:hypothetical protein